MEEVYSFIDDWENALDNGFKPMQSANKVDEVDNIPFYEEVEDELFLEKTSANIVQPSSIGKDSDDPKPTLTDEDAISKVEKLKLKLFNLECDLGKELGGNGEWIYKSYEPNEKKIKEAIKSIKKEIDDLSDKLGWHKDQYPYIYKDGE